MRLRVNHRSCSGCGICRLACAIVNFGEEAPSKALLRIDGRFPAPGDYLVHLCDQCGLCAEICPADAIHLKHGTYRVDPDACSGCGACVDACPNRVMLPDANSGVPAKCNLCGECAAVCPRGAIEMVDSGQERRAE